MSKEDNCYITIIVNDLNQPEKVAEEECYCAIIAGDDGDWHIFKTMEEAIQSAIDRLDNYYVFAGNKYEIEVYKCEVKEPDFKAQCYNLAESVIDGTGVTEEDLAFADLLEKIENAVNEFVANHPSYDIGTLIKTLYVEREDDEEFKIVQEVEENNGQE